MWIHGERILEVPPWTPRIENAYAAWVYARALKQVQDDRKALGEDAYSEQMRGLQRDKASGEYEWGAKIVNASWVRFGSEGNVYLTFLTLSKLDKSITLAYLTTLARADKDAWASLWNDVVMPVNFPPAPEEEDKPEDAPADPSEPAADQAETPAAQP